MGGLDLDPFHLDLAQPDILKEAVGLKRTLIDAGGTDLQFVGLAGLHLVLGLGNTETVPAGEFQPLQCDRPAREVALGECTRHNPNHYHGGTHCAQ